MADPLRRVVAGEPLEIPAPAWNTLMDIARERKLARLPVESAPRGGASDAIMIRVKNTGEVDIPRFGPVRLEAPLFTRTESPASFNAIEAVRGRAPAGPADLVSLAIAFEPIPAGAVGRVVTAGCAVTKVDVVDPDAWFAGCTDDPAALQACQGGPVEILWRESGASGVKWAVVRLQGLASQLEFHVTSAAGMSGKPNRYTYELQLSRLDAETMLPEDVTDGLALPGTNITEDWNDATQVGGMAIADLPSGLSFYAVGDSPGGWVGATVMGWLVRLDGVLQVRFQREMPLLGGCSMSAEDQRDAMGLGALATKDVVTEDELEDEAVSAGKLTASATDVIFGRSSAGAGPGQEIPCTAAGRALLDDADAAAQRTTLGLSQANDGRSLAINSADSTAIASTNSETNFSLSYAIPAGLLNAAGAAIRVRASGRLSSTGTPTLTLRIKAGSVTLFDLGAQSVGAVSNQPWHIDAVVVCRATGASGTLFTVAQEQRVGGRTGTTIGTSATVDLTAAQTLQISAQWSVNNASNTITEELFEVSAVNV